MNKEYELNLVNLRILSKAKASCKLYTNAEVFCYSNPHTIVPEFITRWWYQENRDYSLNKINEVIDKACTVMLSDETSHIYKMRFYNALKDSVSGLKIMKTTYQADISTISRIEIIIDTIDNHLLKYEKQEVDMDNKDKRE